MKKIINDTYQILASPAEGEYKEKGSKFLAYAYPVLNTNDFADRMEDVKAIHPKARHFCYAYRIGIEGKEYRSNDDGEPSGTAGKPIYGQLLSHDVSDTLIIVVRYFGGTKLGASGLITAYKTAAHEALQNGQKKEKVLTDEYVLSFDYGEMGNVMNTLKSQGLEMTSKDFGATPTVIISIPKSETEDRLIRFKAQLLNISTEQVDEKTKVSFCTIEKREIE